MFYLLKEGVHMLAYQGCKFRIYPDKKQIDQIEHTFRGVNVIIC